MEFFNYVLVGFFAQMVNGCLGMAYGVLSGAFLISIGVPPVSASASIHCSKVPVALISGIFHLKFRNVNKFLLKQLVISGTIGGIIGVTFLSYFNSEILRPIVSIYLLILEIYILFKGINRIKLKKMTNKIQPIGFCGGFLDSIGGGGWGPIVTSTLIIRGNSPKRSVGTVSMAEFFVSTAQVIAFFICLGIETQYMQIVLGLTLGGIIAAPLAASMTRKINIKIMTILIGLLIIIINVYTLIKYFL